MTPEPAKNPIRLLLAEDQVMIREALAALLSFEGEFEVVAQVGRGDEVLKAAQDTHPDVAVLDIEMPGLDGLAAAAELKKILPGTKIVILTTFGRPGFLRRAMESGVSAFLVKDSPADKLTQTIRRVLAGELVIDPDLAAALKFIWQNAASGITVDDVLAHVSVSRRLLHLREEINQLKQQLRDR